MAEESVDLRKERAKSSTSPAELEKLAKDKAKDVRMAVAENTNTPLSVLEKLAGDEDEYVRSKASLACLLNVQFVSDLLENK